MTALGLAWAMTVTSAHAEGADLRPGAPREGATTESAAPATVPVAFDMVRFTSAPPTGSDGKNTAWTLVGFDDGGWPTAPLNARAPEAGLGPWIPAPRLPGATVPPTVLPVAFGEGEALHVRARFAAPAAASWRVLEIRCAYADAIVLWLNGRPIARDGVPPEGHRAASSHGPDPQTFYAPLAPGSLRAEGNVLAIEILPGPGASNPVQRSPALAGLTALAATEVRIVRGPYWTRPHADEATLRWETDLPTTGEIVTEAGGKRETHHTPRGTSHSLTLKRLARPAPMTYEVHAKSQNAGTAWTAAGPAPHFPARTEPFSFVVYGDMRAPGHAAHAQVVAAVLRESPSLVMNTGDLVLIGSEESGWQRYFEITRPLGARAAMVPALGNHDAARRGVGARKTWELFGLPPPTEGAAYATSFDVAGVHFVLLDTNHVDERQRAWLAADLTRARQQKTRAIFAFCHAGPFDHGVHGSDSSVARVLAPTLAAAHVDMLFSGHDHIYERGVGPTDAGPLPFIVTGGGGAPLYEPSCRVASAPSSHAGDSHEPGTPGLDLEAVEPLPGRPSGGSPAAADKPLCPPWVAAIAKAYHHVTVSIAGKDVTYCPKATDGTPLEPCFTRPLARP
jgi:hypothetical protein